MFREASVFVPEFIVLRWLRWSNGFVGVVEPDQSIVFYGLESCWRSGVVEPDQSIVFYGFQKSPAWGILSACFLLGMGSTHAGVRLFRNRSFVFYGFQRWREAFCLRVFCLAWARILLVFRSFRIWRWRDFERPSFGIHVSYGFLLGRGSTAAGVRVFRNRSFVFSYGFQRWREAFCLRVFCLAWARILLVFRSFRIWRWRDFEQPSFGIHVSNGFLLGRDSTAAGVRVFRNRSFVFYVKHSVVFSTVTLTRLSAAIVRNPRRSGVPEPDQSFFNLVFFIFLADYRFQRWREAFCHRVFCLAWARILLAFGCCGTGRKHCFLWARILLAFGCFGTFLLFFYGFQRWREAFCLRVFCLAWARILLVFRSFRIWRWRELTRLWAAIVRNPRFERFFVLLGRGSTAAGVRVFRNRSFVFFSYLLFFIIFLYIFIFSYGFQRWREAKHSVCVFFAWHGLESCWCFGLFESDADETLSSHRSESTFLLVVICAFRTVFCLAEARLLLAFGCFGTEALFFIIVFYGFQRWREAFCLRVFCFGIHVPACGYIRLTGFSSQISSSQISRVFLKNLPWKSTF